MKNYVIKNQIKVLKELDNMTSKDASRTTINVICVDKKNNVVVATDGHLLGCISIYYFNDIDYLKNICPNAGLFFKDINENYAIIYNSKFSVNVNDDFIFTFVYPNYKRVIPDIKNLPNCYTNSENNCYFDFVILKRAFDFFKIFDSKSISEFYNNILTGEPLGACLLNCCPKFKAFCLLMPMRVNEDKNENLKNDIKECITFEL